MFIAIRFIAVNLRRMISMSSFSKFLPAVALAVALAPFAAQARSDLAPVQDPAHELFLVGGYNSSAAQNAHGRVAAVNVPTSVYAVDAATQYAAIQSLPQEN
jgi:hypothetical protein